MKRLIFFYLVVILLLFFILAYPEEHAGNDFLPDDFGTRVFNHIVHLAGLGHRQVGTENDRLAIRYIKRQLENIGLDVEIQPFEFESFEYTNIDLEIGEESYDVVGLGFNPYKNKREYEGIALLVDLNDSQIPYALDELKGKTVITNNWSGHFRLLRFKPELIIYVDSEDFDVLKSQGELCFRLNIEGEYRKYTSANIIGTVGNEGLSANGGPPSKEFLITAHFDTYRKNNPGASDNASGVGILLELARRFKKIEDELVHRVKFVAFGAEEIGIIGSRNYLYNNTESLRQCELLFNIDDVGGNGSVLVEMTGGISGIPETKCLSQIPETVKTSPWEGIDSCWRMQADDDLMKILAASNHPDWLVEVINRSVEELGYDIRPTGTQGSDQLAFAQAGIVTSGIGIISNFSHTPQDIPSRIDKKSLKIAGEITAYVVLNAMRRISASLQ
ncbi:MAG: M20/M25/M40 family metallo-hydrolase [Candidatus Aminicenantes bacterium]|jgi:hypothetical protein